MPKNNSVIALLTDFGHSEHYVSAMKGVILSISRHTSIVDLAHDVEPHNIANAAYLLWASYRYFPKKTVFACVVDPGVGTSREIIVARTKNHMFLAPQNGILDYVLWTEDVHTVTVVEMRSPGVRSILPAAISKTFHGRDIFAPISAHLARGFRFKALGKNREVDWIAPPFVDTSNPLTSARILDIDRFGNIITNIAGVEYDRPPEIKGVTLGGTRIIRWIENYETAPTNVPCLIIGSTGLVEIVMKRQSAAAALKAKEGVSLGVLRT